MKIYLFYKSSLLAASRHRSCLNLYLMNVCFPPESCPLPGAIFSYLKVGKRLKPAESSFQFIDLSQYSLLQTGVILNFNRRKVETKL